MSQSTPQTQPRLKARSPPEALLAMEPLGHAQGADLWHAAEWKAPGPGLGPWLQLVHQILEADADEFEWMAEEEDHTDAPSDCVPTPHASSLSAVDRIHTLPLHANHDTPKSLLSAALRADLPKTHTTDVAADPIDTARPPQCLAGLGSFGSYGSHTSFGSFGSFTFSPSIKTLRHE